MKEIQGIAAARGFALGPAFQFGRAVSRVDDRQVEDPAHEVERLEHAIDLASQEIKAVHEKAQSQLSQEDASIFEAHLLMLQDPELQDGIRKAILERKLNSEAAVQEATDFYAQALEAMDSDYFRARAVDVRDIAQRLLRVLNNGGASAPVEVGTPSIIIAQDLMPSDTILLDKRLVLGLCTVQGSETSHTAILARALGIPAVVGAGADILAIPTGQELILDGVAGKVLADPPASVRQDYQARRASFLAAAQDAVAGAAQAAVTRDGVRVDVIANVGSLAAARTAIEQGAEGIGLLRTEFLYMERDTLPNEEEQYAAYSGILDVFGSLPVTLRTSDIGGDKPLPYLPLPHEANPFLGIRGLRLALLHPAELLKPQLRAALRAGCGHDLRIMFPMVAAREEILQARRCLDECRQELIASGLPASENLQVGIMVEVPAAALMADVLARDVDFFSIGTNDLTQYALAADRTNSQLAYLASAFSPAVLRLIQNVIVQAHACQKKVAVCGELAGEPLAIPILLGLGLDEFSMNPQSIPAAKLLMRSLSASECRTLAAQALKLESAEDVKACVRDAMPGLS